MSFNSLPPSAVCWKLNILDPDLGPDQASDLGPNCFDTQIVLLKEFFEKVDFEKNSADNN